MTRFHIFNWNFETFKHPAKLNSTVVSYHKTHVDILDTVFGCHGHQDCRNRRVWTALIPLGSPSGRFAARGGLANSL